MGNESTTGFDNDKYIKNQIEEFEKRIGTHSKISYIEFGGKPFGDHHASRVLPGYDPDAKARILKELNPCAKIVMVLNAQDILMPPNGRTLTGRIRGDSGLRYDLETLKLIERSQELGLNVQDVVLGVIPTSPSPRTIEQIHAFSDLLLPYGLHLKKHYAIDGYPNIDSIGDEINSPFDRNDSVSEEGKNLIVFSPGGGSGKFGVLLSEFFHALKRGEYPNFVKFETFPVFKLRSTHPLNLAFEAATADLGNRVVDIDEETTNYDKDIENFPLLQRVFSMFSIQEHPICKMINPTDMGVNVIETGITNTSIIIEACKLEILRRLTRYRDEFHRGLEKLSTVERTELILQRFNILYP